MQSEMKIPSPDELMTKFVISETKEIVDLINNEDELNFIHVLLKHESYGSSTRIVMNNVANVLTSSGWSTRIEESKEEVTLYIEHPELDSSKVS